MKLHELRSPEGARKESRRVGRGTGSGRGKTAGRGTKGQNARGEGFRIGFEGGQMPLAMRLPKLGGFKNPFKRQFTVINLTKLNRFENGASVNAELLVLAGLAEKGEKIKILGTGKLGRKLAVEADAFSETARAAIEAKGGSVTVIELPARPEQTKRGPSGGQGQGDANAAKQAAASVAKDDAKANRASAAKAARAADAAEAPSAPSAEKAGDEAQPKPEEPEREAPAGAKAESKAAEPDGAAAEDAPEPKE